MGSGKNTVASIIQYLHSKSDKSFEEWSKPIIHKPTGYDISLRSTYEIIDGNWMQKSFASKLKYIASILTGIAVEKFEDQEFKKTNLGDEWSYFPELKVNTIEDVAKNFENALMWGSSKMTVREFLQRLGTDAVRDNLHRNTWVNALMVDYKPEYVIKYGLQEMMEDASKYNIKEYPKWIVTDCRFPNEVEAIKAREGVIIRVNRNIVNGIYVEPNPGFDIPRHQSETALDTWNFDAVIDNSGTIEELIEKVRKVIIDDLNIVL